jgi:hypothetical protein
VRYVAQLSPALRYGYPEVAEYKGSGSIDDAANFSCGKQQSKF